jgi:hypothetical protein
VGRYHGFNTAEKIAHGLASAGSVVAGAADGPDLHYRGQQGTPPRIGELTKSEAIRVKIRYPVAPSPGQNYPIEATWTYTRATTGRSYTFGASDKRTNLHFLKAYEVDAPAAHPNRENPLKICARFQKADGSYYRGNELYVAALLISDKGPQRRFLLLDNATGLDSSANDSQYCGGYRFQTPAVDPPGKWFLFVFAQDVNTVLEGTAPFIAAHTIGGMLLTTQLELQFNKPCKLDYDAVITVA